MIAQKFKPTEQVWRSLLNLADNVDDYSAEFNNWNGRNNYFDQHFGVVLEYDVYPGDWKATYYFKITNDKKFTEFLLRYA